MTRRPKVVGVVGGIGSGKSTAAALLARRSRGRLVVADALGHEALRQSAIREALVEKFGPGILDEQGVIDRRRLGRIVFRDRQDLQYLEAWSHPYIGRRMAEEVRRAGEEGAPLVVIDAALLFEAGWDAVCDEVVFIDAPPEVREARVARARGWPAGEVEKRESAQLPLTRKHSRADHTITNASTEESLGQQVDDLLGRWGLPREASPPEEFAPPPASSCGAEPTPDVPLRGPEGMTNPV